ncbi:Rieske (2Fe-2S) protein [Methanolobus sediminis]|uniref:Rieske (2Fe-2S) protein n=1 Tax=Methanolobus sediminis TaxID=3072978 RepID=A0AA51UPE6_9EURY|nr:Rieske (2Fe-2S) protein [Methanolobus sediminis]WMW26056.1 Rieske (2Fe-2S) protein [Methanolobus sediminis]
MKQEDNWIFAIKKDDLGNGEKKPLLIEGNKLLVLRIDDDFFAMSNKCPHMECPLSKGTLEEYVIKCPCHDWRFDVREGKFLDAEEIRVPIYETRIMEEGVFVNLRKEGAGK